MKGKIIQIQCCSIENTSSTQCNVFLYALTDKGKLYFKRDIDIQWREEPINL